MELRVSEADVNKEMINKVVAQSKGDGGVDNITLNMAMQSMSTCQKAAGDEAGAKATVTELVGIFEKKGLRKEVLSQIKEEAN